MRAGLRQVFVSILFIVILPIGVSAEDGAGDQLTRLLEDAWQYRLEANPLFASYIGNREYDGRLPEVGREAERRHAEKIKEFLDRLHGIDRSALSDADKINYDIYERLQNDELAEYEYGTYMMPITNRSGFFVSFPQLPKQVTLKTVKNYDDYVSRLRAFKVYTEQYIELMREGIKRGYVLPAVVLQGIEGAIAPHIVDDPRESLLYEPFEQLPDGFDVKDKERLQEAGRDAVERSIVPAYREFLAFMTDEYIPAGREEIGASSLPRGREFYEHRVRSYTTLDKTPEEIHEIGQSEVARIHTEMQEIIDGVGFNGSFREFVEFLRTDGRFYVDTPDALMKEVALVLKRMDGELPGLFKTLPRTPYGIKPVPDYIAPKTTTAYYNEPAGDGSRAGFYFVNTYDLSSRPLYEIEALSLHEAVPGHHLQIALMQELTDTPTFRRFTGFTAFVEGWALYAERLGLEVGFYEDPYSNFGRLTYEMWRACRLVVDTGMHYMGWTRQQAIDFMAANTALTLHNITTEVDRYISWPGQALAYKMGELKIRELRAYAEHALGPDFDLREFHDVVLGSGAVPLDVLDANVRKWVDERP